MPPGAVKGKGRWIVGRGWSPQASSRLASRAKSPIHLLWNIQRCQIRLFHTFVYPQVTSSQNAAEKILVIAEKLFAIHGFDGVTLRQLTSAADVNLAAVNYHHTDKESLFRRILGQRLAQLSTERLKLLNAAEARANGHPVPLEEIADCLAAPLLQPVETMTGFGAHSRRLIGRSLVEPLPFLADILAADFHPAVARCGQAFRRHLPSLPPADFLWQYSFVVGALHHAAATLHDMNALTRGICADEDSGLALRNFRAFASETFRALSRA